MRIRKMKTRQVGDKTYYTHRLVHSVRIGDQVEQVYLLNLGARFDVPEEDWKTLCWCILERLRGQRLLPLVPDAIQAEAEELVQRLVTRQRERLVQARLIEPDTRPAQWMSVDVANQTQHDSRTAGIEQVGLWALRQVGLVALLSRLGFSASLRRAVVGAVIGRMAHPASDRETHRWLREDSALGEYLSTDYAPSTVQQLYRASDALVDHREAIEAHLYAVTQQLFGLGPAVTLLDLTNTYLEGEAKAQTRAKRGHSKEKRSDCPLITLALVLDDNGLVQRSRVYAGNVSEPGTLEAMLEGLQAPGDAIVVLDRGVATESNVTWLKEQGRRYLVVSREQVARV